MDIKLTARFEQDFAKRIAGTPLDAEFEDLLGLLVSGATLPSKYRDHPLKGDRSGVRDCHLRANMVLLYSRSDKLLKLVRIGTHADLFG